MRQALPPACPLEGVEDLLRGGGRVDIECDPACPHQVGLVPDLSGRPGHPHSANEGGHPAEDKDGGLRGNPDIGVGDCPREDSKAVERAISRDSNASNPVVSWKCVFKQTGGDPRWADPP